jgi:hypothetical protein
MARLCRQPHGLEIWQMRTEKIGRSRCRKLPWLQPFLKSGWPRR